MGFSLILPDSPILTCSVDGCVKPIRSRGFCAAHYNRWKRHGDPGAAVVRVKRPRREANTPCEVDGCNGAGTRRGLCGKHYRRLMDHGDPLREPPTTVDRFWDKVTKTETCWLWTAAKDRQGYGRFRNGESRRTMFAHRFAYELLVGPIPNDLTIDHLCKVVECVYPEHMEPVPNGVNAMRGDGAAATNARKTHCSRGHEFNEENTYVSPSGRRQCRACARITEARTRR